MFKFPFSHNRSEKSRVIRIHGERARQGAGAAQPRSVKRQQASSLPSRTQWARRTSWEVEPMASSRGGQRAFTLGTAVWTRSHARPLGAEAIAAQGERLRALAEVAAAALQASSLTMLAGALSVFGVRKEDLKRFMPSTSSEEIESAFWLSQVQDPRSFLELMKRYPVSGIDLAFRLAENGAQVTPMEGEFALSWTGDLVAAPLLRARLAGASGPDLSAAYLAALQTIDGPTAVAARAMADLPSLAVETPERSTAPHASPSFLRTPPSGGPPSEVTEALAALRGDLSEVHLLQIQLHRELRGFSERFPAELRQELREVKRPMLAEMQKLSGKLRDPDANRKSIVLRMSDPSQSPTSSPSSPPESSAEKRPRKASSGSLKSTKCSNAGTLALSATFAENQENEENVETVAELIQLTQNLTMAELLSFEGEPIPVPADPAQAVKGPVQHEQMRTCSQREIRALYVENSSVGKVHYLKSIETEAKKYWGNQASVVIDVCSPGDFAGEVSGAPEQLAKLSGYDFIVLGGGKCTSMTDHEGWMDLLQALRVPLICLGSQQLTKAYGMKLSKLDDKFVGTRPFMGTPSDLAFSHQFGTCVKDPSAEPARHQEFEGHADFQVLWSEQLVAADGKKSEISMLYEYLDSSGKYMLGVQGHPEKPDTDESVRQELFHRFFAHVRDQHRGGAQETRAGQNSAQSDACKDQLVATANAYLTETLYGSVPRYHGADALSRL
eukprot:s30_g27.t1